MKLIFYIQIIFLKIINELRIFSFIGLWNNRYINHKKRIFKNYHQQGANLNYPDQNIEFMVSENNNYHQILNAYFQYDSTVLEVNGENFTVTNDDATNELNRLMKNGFADCFEEGGFPTTGVSDGEHNKSEWQISTIMRLITNKDWDLLSHFDKINETQDGVFNSSLKHMFINNHEIEVNRGKIKGYLNLEDLFGVCRTFKK